MKRTLLCLILTSICIVSASAQNSSYKIFDRKRGSAYQPSLVGADEKFIYVFTSGITNETAQHRDKDALLNTYRTSDFAPVKSKETDFTFKGKELDHAQVHVFGKYVLLTYHDYDRKKSALSMVWIALNRETLEPAKDGVLGANKLTTLDNISVHVSADGQSMMIVYGNHEKQFIACFDKDMNILWESELSIANNERVISEDIDNNQNIYLLVREVSSPDSKKKGALRIMTLKNKATSKDAQAVELPGGKGLYSVDIAVSGDGNIFIGGLYSADAGPEGVFTMKIDAGGAKTSDSRELPDLNKKSTLWRTSAGVTDHNEFYFYTSNSSLLEINSYTSSGAPAGGYSSYLLDGYVAVYADASGKIDHAMKWNHFPIPVPDVPVSIAPMIYNGKPYLFTDYSMQQMDKWGKADYSKEVPSAKERIKSPTRQLCSVGNIDDPGAAKPTQIFPLDNGFFGCSAARYVPALHTMIFFGCVTEGKYGQGWTNFCLGKTVLK